MLKTLLLGTLLATFAVVTLVPDANAQRRDRWRDNHWRHHDQRPYVYTAPNRYYYAPPPVVYAPAPVYPGFSLNFGF